MITQSFTKFGHSYRVERTETKVNLFDVERTIIVYVDNCPYRILKENSDGFLDVYEAKNQQTRFYELLTLFNDYQFNPKGNEI